MCGIIGAVLKPQSQRNLTQDLLFGLEQLEYRGYDSAGICLLEANHTFQLLKSSGKLEVLKKRLQSNPSFTQSSAKTGIAHVRWATHGEPSEINAHPHTSSSYALVHNGTIENYLSLQSALPVQSQKSIISQTDSEVVLKLFEHLSQTSLDIKDKQMNAIACLAKVVKQLEGSFSLCLINRQQPNQMLIAKQNTPLCLGLGDEGVMVASDATAFASWVKQVVYLEDGDLVEVKANSVNSANSVDYFQIYNTNLKPLKREAFKRQINDDNQVVQGPYPWFMAKEIAEQSSVIEQTLSSHLSFDHLYDDIFGSGSDERLQSVRQVHILACGSSYHAGLVAKYWIEQFVRVPVYVEIASEFIYRKPALLSDSLVVFISQSGETADTISALKQVLAEREASLIQNTNHSQKLSNILTLAICNRNHTDMVRLCDLSFITQAGCEKSVASTKAFTCQMAALMLLTLKLAQLKGCCADFLKGAIKQLFLLPELIEQTLREEITQSIRQFAKAFYNYKSMLFVGRGVHYPIAMEGALKLKEISYIHAECYAAGELKHGPIALIDKYRPVIALCPQNELYQKVATNLKEVEARGGQLLVFQDFSENLPHDKQISLPHLSEKQSGQIENFTSPFIFTVALQVFAYEVTLFLGHNVDQPRNLAKSVTVE